jgi:surfeit locus 1 family protein
MIRPPASPWRRLLLPSVVTLLALLVLLGLGTWQVERLAWKTDLLARFAAAETAPPVPLTDPPPPFGKVAATGRFDHAREALVGIELRGTTLGARLVTPLLRPGAPPILVDRGWVPLERDRPVSHPDGDVTVTGWVHPGETPGWTSATDDAAGRRFFTLDPGAIGAALGLPRAAPFVLVAMGAAEGLPQPSATMPRPTNNHLGYAITWFGLAAGLLGVFLVWARHRLKEKT